MTSEPNVSGLDAAASDALRLSREDPELARELYDALQLRMAELRRGASASPPPARPGRAAALSPSSSPIGPGAGGALSLSLPPGATPDDPEILSPIGSRPAGGGEEGDEGAEVWRSALVRSRDDGIKNTQANALFVLQHDERVRAVLGWDEHRSDVMVLEHPPWLPRGIRRAYPLPLEDIDITYCVGWLQKQHKASWTSAVVAEQLVAIAHLRRFHPLRDYLVSLHWDGVERLNDWLVDYLGVDGSEINRTFGRLFLIGAVARVMRPGCKMDTVLMLEGGEGARKSSALRVLATGTTSTDGPTAGWFCDESLQLDHKDGLMKLAGVWIYELAEVPQFKRNEWETIKAFITRGVDKFRFPWARRPVTIPRSSVFVGTTNDERYLQPGVNRRFWPVKCGDRLDLENLAAMRDQLWAEAVARFHLGERWWLEEHLQVQAAATVEERVEIDPWEEAISRYCEGRTSTTMADLLYALGFVDAGKREKVHQIRAGRILSKLGFVKTRPGSGAGRPTVYTRPEPDDVPGVTAELFAGDS